MQAYIGITGPYLRQRIWARDPSIDLTTATAITLNITAPDRSTATWTTTIVSAQGPSAAGGSMLIWQHAWSVGDIVQVGRYTIQPVISMLGNPSMDGAAKYLYSLNRSTALGLQ